MSPMRYLSALSARGIRLEKDASAASGVCVVGPPDVLTSRVTRRIQQALPSLLPHLSRHRQLVRLGAEVEALLTQEEDARAILHDPLLKWLKDALARAEALEERHGSHWWRDTSAGKDLLADLRAFRDAYLR